MSLRNRNLNSSKLHRFLYLIISRDSNNTLRESCRSSSCEFRPWNWSFPSKSSKCIRNLRTKFLHARGRSRSRISQASRQRTRSRSIAWEPARAKSQVECEISGVTLSLSLSSSLCFFPFHGVGFSDWTRRGRVVHAWSWWQGCRGRWKPRDGKKDVAAVVESTSGPRVRKMREGGDAVNARSKL